MNPNAPWLGWLKAGGIFLVCLFASCLLPIVAVYGHAFLPRGFSNILFFFPQMAFPFDSVVVDSASGQQTVFSHRTSWILSVVQWGLLTVGFAWLARPLKIRYALLVAAVVIVTATFGTYYGVKMFGATVALDGP